MTEESLLIVIAEVAAALAGFSGIAAAFGRRQERTWSANERARLADLLNHSGIALFASLTPLVFAQRDGFNPDLWRNSSFFWAGFAVIGVGLRLRGLLSRRASGELRRAALSLSMFGALIVYQLYNALFWHMAFPYLTALVCNLGFAFVQFTSLVNPSSGDDDA